MEVLSGIEILWSDEFYDGAVDGLARYGMRELWFCVDSSRTTWYSERPRRYLAYELTKDELARVHAVYLADQAADFGMRKTRALGVSWEMGDGTGYAPADRDPVGCFTR